VPTRRISFEESLASLQRRFTADGNVFSTHTIVSLSAVFPDGEDFFVRSVRNLRDKVEDPELKKQVAGFIGQEATHGREHRILNRRFDELGYDTTRLAYLTRQGLVLREKVMGKKSNLAVTAALEHFTATFAETLLSEPAAREAIGDPAIRDVFLWHALEESEHKAVAFDVYKAVGGSERLRTFTMNAIGFGFISGMAISIAVGVAIDPDTYRRRGLVRSFREYLRLPFFSKSMWRRIRDYNRADFHPDDHNSDELVAYWRAELFGDDGRLNHLLAGAA
jgi:predicted metal-dependent hydrolase